MGSLKKVLALLATTVAANSKTMKAEKELAATQDFGNLYASQPYTQE